MLTTFLPKEDQELPDAYGITVMFVTGKREEYEVASHRIKDAVLEFVTSMDEWHLLPMSSVLELKFDKRFSKVVALREKRMKDAT